MEVKDQDGKIEIPSSLGHNNTFPSSSLPSNQNFNHGKNVLLNSPIIQTLNQNHLPNPLQYSLRPRRSDHHDHQTLDPPTSSTSTDTAASPVRYRECLKNHAAKTGGHVLDGCGEFMPTGQDGTPESFTCAACECHRNFHRRESQSQPQHSLTYYYNNYHNSVAAPPSSHFNHHHHHQQMPVGAPVMMTFAGAVVESSSEDLDMYRNYTTSDVAAREGSGEERKKRRRFRTKFSEEQKMKMMEFAEKIGWKIQKKEEEEVDRFCCQVGVKRQVFKVWMHNNKLSN